METKETEKKQQKSTFLFVLSLLFLLNGAHLFRTSINTTFFTEDISGDYTAVEATVIEYKTETADKAEEELKLIPVFSFPYKDDSATVEEENFAFDRDRLSNQPYQLDETYSLWVHKRWGKLIVPPIMAPKELGRSQLYISLVFLLLAVAVWILRNKIADKGMH